MNSFNFVKIRNLVIKQAAVLLETILRNVHIQYECSAGQREILKFSRSELFQKTKVALKLLAKAKKIKMYQNKILNLFGYSPKKLFFNNRIESKHC